MPGPRSSAAARAEGMRQEQELAARWVEDFLAPGYGPHGGAKLLVDGDAPTWVASPAAALADAAIAHPAVQPYVDLARKVRRDAGDQATAATLLAARLVRNVLGAGAPVGAALEGLRLARRQALATLRGATLAATPAGALWSVADDARLASVVADGLPQLGPSIDLDDVDVRAEGVPAPQWTDGVVCSPQNAPPGMRQGEGGVLLLGSGWSFKPRVEGAALRIKDARQAATWLGVETALRGEAVTRLQALRVGFVACAAAVDDDLAGRLRDAGILLWTDCPRSSLRRLERATGARVLATAREAKPADVGRAAWQRRAPPLEGWTVTGDGPAATLLVPAIGPARRAAAAEDAERVLRACGLVLAQPGAVPGGGRWQRSVASALGKSADAAPGKAPLGVLAASQAFDALADDLVRNAGRDPLAQALLADVQGVLDAAACVRHAVAAAFDAAIALLRVDARHSKRPSSTHALRGGSGPVGSPRGLPGDIPPLM